MSELIGANLDDLDALAALFKRTADRITQLSGELDRAVQVAWAGRDADAFRSAWCGTHRSKLQAAVAGLHDATHNLATQRADQAQASGGNSPGVLSGIGSRLGHLAPYALSVAPLVADAVLEGHSVIEEGKLLAGLSRHAVELDGPGLWDVAGLAWDGKDLVGSWQAFVAGSGSGDAVLRDGIDVVWDAGGMAVPEVGAAKLAWDTGYRIGALGERGLEATFHHEEAILTHAMQEQYGMQELTPAAAADFSHRYDGVTGFGHFAEDSIGALFR